MSDKIDDKWITPAGLSAETGIPLSTITTWIKSGYIASMELPGNTKKRRHMVDRTNVPDRRSVGRPVK